MDILGEVPCLSLLGVEGLNCSSPARIISLLELHFGSTSFLKHTLSQKGILSTGQFSKCN